MSACVYTSFEFIAACARSLLAEVRGVDEELLGVGSRLEHDALPCSWPWEVVSCSCPKGGRMAHGIPSQGKVTVTVDEYSSNPTQAFTHYNINQSRFQPPHVHM